MQEKKLSNGVIRIRMNTCTILALIILPFLLFMLYVILFSECSELLKKSGVRIASPKFNYLKRNESDDEKNDSDENNVSVDIYKELGITDNNPLTLINKVQLNEDNENVPVTSSLEESLEEPFVISIIRVIILPDYSESVAGSDEKTIDEKENYGDINENITEANNVNEWNELLSYTASIPKEPSKKKDLTSSPEDETQLQKEEEAEKKEYKEKEDSTKIVLPDRISFDNKPEEENKKPENSNESNTETQPLPALVLPSDSTKATLATKDVSDKLHEMYYDFMDFSIPNSFICPEDGENMNLLVGIHSDVENFEQRKAIRETWSKVARVDGLNYAFIVGIGTSDAIDNKVKHESDEFQDIIQTDILARRKYRDANAVMFLKWIKKYCPLVEYVIKVDDNVFLNLPQISTLIKENEVKDNEMYGDLYVNELPDRNPESEDYVPTELYAGDTYPEFLNRAGYLFPGKLAPILYDEARKMPYFPGENILITGIIAEKLNITRQDTSNLFGKYSNVENQLEKCSFLKYSIVYPVTPDEMRSLWDEIKSEDYKCFNFLENMLGMIDDKEGSENIYDQQAKLYDLLNDTKFTQKNAKYKEILE